MMAIIVGIICAVVGSYLIVQELALLGDVISHSALRKSAIAYTIRANVLIFLTQTEFKLIISKL